MSRSIQVMSFNARNSGANDGINSWTHRKASFFERIAAFDPDLIGFQEVLPDQYTDIRAALNQHTLYGQPREEAGERSLLAFRTARFDLRSSGDFWLSQTPDVPHSRSWDSACIRICSWATLHDRSVDRELLFANVHWDHKGLIARQQSAGLCKRQLTKLANGLPVILTGDFNSVETDPWMAELMTSSKANEIQFIDSYRAVQHDRSKRDATVHDFKGNLNGERIDFIFHTSQLITHGASIDVVSGVNGRYPSDHYAVVAKLAW